MKESDPTQERTLNELVHCNDDIASAWERQAPAWRVECLREPWSL